MSDTRCTCGGGCVTFGECIRRKGIRIGYCRSTAGLDFTAEQRHTRELDSYAAARRQGIQPAGTQLHQTQHALDASDLIGRAFDAGATVT